MNNQSHCCPVIGIPVTTVSFQQPEEPAVLCDDCKQDKKHSVSNWTARFRINKASKSREEQVNLWPKLSRSTVKGKLRFLKRGGVEREFRKAFSVVSDKEKLLKSSQCYLSTTAGPIAGTLFISTERIAFLSETPLKLTSHINGDITRFHYKVVIPLSRVENAIPVENFEIPNRKYIQIVTVDEFDFWFMGFDASYQDFLNKLQETISGR